MGSRAGLIIRDAHVRVAHGGWLPTSLCSYFPNFEHTCSPRSVLSIPSHNDEGAPSSFSLPFYTLHSACCPSPYFHRPSLTKKHKSGINCSPFSPDRNPHKASRRFSSLPVMSAFFPSSRIVFLLDDLLLFFRFSLACLAIQVPFPLSSLIPSQQTRHLAPIPSFLCSDQVVFTYPAHFARLNRIFSTILSSIFNHP